MADKSLILTADDFGRSEAINACVEQWACAGALTQASLMVNEYFAGDAVRAARRFPNLRVGLHLTLCDGFDSAGHVMRRSPAWVGMVFAFSPAARFWLQREIGAQFQRFLDFGLEPTYWDGHAHLHMHPVVMEIAVPIAVRHGFRFTRLLREPGRPALLPWIFQCLSRHAAPRLRKAEIGFADRVFGLRKTGRMDAAEMERAISSAHSGVTEVYFHPGAESRLPAPEWWLDRIRKSGF